MSAACSRALAFLGRPRAAPARRRIPRAHRWSAFGALSTLSSRPCPRWRSHGLRADPGLAGPAHLPSGPCDRNGTRRRRGPVCFRTAYPLTPLAGGDRLGPAVGHAPCRRLPNSGGPRGAVSCLRISLRVCQSHHGRSRSLASTGCASSWAAKRGSALLELLLAHTISIALGRRSGGCPTR